MALLENKYSLGSGHKHRYWDTKPLLAIKKLNFFTLSGNGDVPLHSLPGTTWSTVILSLLVYF